MSRITNAFHFTGLAGITVALSLSPAALAMEIHVPGDYSKIQTAIQNANNGDVIIVHPDDYLEHLNLMGRAITVRSIDPTDPGIVKTTRIIGPGPKATVTCDTGEGVQTSIIGFTIMHQDPPSDYASGMYNDHAAPTVRYCVFAENHADYGGGMHNYYSDPKVANCTFDDNVGVAGGGGMYNDHSAPGVTDCHFIGNDTGPDFNGAGMHNVNSHVTVTECTFTSNRSDGRGGGMYNLDSPAMSVLISAAPGSTAWIRISR